MVSSGEMTLVWPDTGTADHGWSHHNYFINTHGRCEGERESAGQLMARVLYSSDHSEQRSSQAGPFITRVINCGEISRGDSGVGCVSSGAHWGHTWLATEKCEARVFYNQTVCKLFRWKVKDCKKGIRDCQQTGWGPPTPVRTMLSSHWLLGHNGGFWLAETSHE